ncbi:MAG: hypothetical protein AAF184_14325 [Pseudomonadota bacterium]
MTMRNTTGRWTRLALLLMASAVLSACGGGEDSGGGANPANANVANNQQGNAGGGGGGPAPSNKARFTFDCDLQGIVGVLTLDVEVINSAGVVFGSGPNPDITAVIGTGNVTIFTSGELVSSTASYIFTGENQFADFTKVTGTIERFLVEWVEQPDGLTLVINPFGPGTTRQDCLLTGSSFL